jgi:glycosyltransferase involved in cell wall biosynthesis
MVDVYIALTEFARRKFVEGGIPAEKLTVKPNFVYPDPGPGKGRGGYALFVGRLSPEKGVGTLLAAYRHLDKRSPLKVVGGGPLARKVVEAASRHPYIEYLGYRPPEEVQTLMKEASIIVLPSEWYEGFSRVAAEAFATATPIVAAALGAANELVEHGRTGLRFRPGDPEDLAAQIRWYFCHAEEHARMRREVRAEYESKYTARKNYEMLMEIYGSASDRHEVSA